MKSRHTSFYQDYQLLFQKLVNHVQYGTEALSQEIRESYAHTLFQRVLYMYFLHSQGLIAFENYIDQSKNLCPNNRTPDKKPNDFCYNLLFSLWFGIEQIQDKSYFDWGLFDPIENLEITKDEWTYSKIIIDHDIWSQIFSTFANYHWSCNSILEINEFSNLITPSIIADVFEHFCEKKNTGSVYTPRLITKYMCQRSLDLYFTDRLNQKLGKTKNQTYRSVLNDLLDSNENNSQKSSQIEIFFYEILVPLTICDNACGCGHFLVEMFEILRQYIIKCLDSLREIDFEKIRKINHVLEDNMDLSASFWSHYILTHILYGVDLSSAAINIAKMQLILKLLTHNSNIKKIMFQDIDAHICAGNSLLGYISKPLSKDHIEDNPNSWNNLLITQIHKEKKETPPFDERILYDLHPIHWPLIFPTVIANGGFDIIISNPPYIKEYMNRDAFRGLHNSPYYQGKMDLWYLFLCRGLDLLKSDGIITYIAQNNWVTSAGASKLRKKVISESQILEFLDFNENKIFPNAEIQTMITILKKSADLKQYTVEYGRIHKENVNTNELTQFLYNPQAPFYVKFHAPFDRSNYMSNPEQKLETIEDVDTDAIPVSDAIYFQSAEIHTFFNKVRALPNIIFLQPTEIANGTDPHQYNITKKHQQTLGKQFAIGTGIFVLNQAEKQKIPFNARELTEIVKPFYTAEQFGRYFAHPINKSWIIYTSSEINKKITDYPNVKKHLDPFIPIVTSDFKPYGLHRSRDPSIFQGPRLFSLRKCEQPTFCYVNFEAYVGQAFNIIKTSRIDLKYLLGLFNSSFAFFWFYNFGKRQGKLLQIDGDPLLRFPIVNPPENEKKQIIQQVNQLLEELSHILDVKNEDRSRIRDQVISKFIPQIDQIIFQLYHLTPSEIVSIERIIKCVSTD